MIDHIIALNHCRKNGGDTNSLVTNVGSKEKAQKPGRQFEQEE
jgi:hypothetical protein